MRLSQRNMRDASETLVDAYHHLKRRMWTAFRSDLDRAAHLLMIAGEWVSFDEQDPDGRLHRQYRRCLRVIAGLRRRLPETPELERILIGYADRLARDAGLPPVYATVTPICIVCRSFGRGCCKAHRDGDGVIVAAERRSR